VWSFDTNVSETCASTLNREAVWSSETMVSNHQNTRRNNPENHKLHLHCHVNNQIWHQVRYKIEFRNCMKFYCFPLDVTRTLLTSSVQFCLLWVIYGESAYVMYLVGSIYKLTRWSRYFSSYKCLHILAHIKSL
jgi:hypothetical protein